MTETYRWNGHHGRGAMAGRRRQRRDEATERNNCGQRWADRRSCGHNHFDSKYNRTISVRAIAS